MGASKEHQTSLAQTITHEASAHKAELAPAIVGTLTGVALRYDGWGNFNGTVNFGFNWDLIHANSHVYVSASEVDNAGNRFNGSAPYTVQNIVVKEMCQTLTPLADDTDFQELIRYHS